MNSDNDEGAGSLASTTDQGPLVLNGIEIPKGTRRTLSLPVARRYTAGEVSLPVCVIHGRRPGPRLFVSAAIHGDEINGVEIVRRLLKRQLLPKLRGALIAVPVVNVYGFVEQTRYLPDRRDLNRCFPGSAKGSLASRLANTFLQEVAKKATHGIDLHTGSLHRTNLPQVRASLDVPGSEALARSFGAPVILDSAIREGSLRESVGELGVPMIIYEAGEALRFDELAIKAGLRGVLSVMRDLGMLPAVKQKSRRVEPFVAHGSSWVRAPESGILVTKLQLGARVARGQWLGTISDPLAEEEEPIISPTDGVLIGRTNLPLVNEGDAVFHIGVFERLDPVADEVDYFQDELTPDS
ncbi:succinylglutamate desuccinylase/aspartoacylase family protein [Engelhardtia mirabilis]|uniref:Aspartoacylase n=1 Tax=Engelhardtia mirabilis TaxID=2528011 RepID=A0A518BM29_9BACT|nr:aspartoacylase [Planctomycetes bacterium Pla133]QDV02365.1 aspartoacylase [Planctomycetes bacterium Pla86]